MPPTFAGSYLREPIDFSTVTTEAALIQVADDPSTPVISIGVLEWSELSAPEKAALVATLNPLIVSKEGLINGYLRAGGYTVPTDPGLNPVVQEYAARLVWNALRYRKAQITDEQLASLDGAVLKELKDIAGGMVLLLGEDVAIEPVSSAVHAIGTSPRIFSRKSMEDM